MLNEDTILFKILIALDRLLNVLTGGSFMICLSTRAHKRSLTGDLKWLIIRNRINWMFNDNEHCENSFRWEMRLKKEWYEKHKDLL
jgi:hypothetical protein